MMSNSSNINNTSFPVDVSQSEDIVLVNELIDFVVNCVLLTIIAPIGLVGNILNIIVLSGYNIKTDTSTILLLALAVADFLYCLTILPRRSRCLVNYFLDEGTALTIEAFMWTYVVIFNRLVMCISQTMVAVIALERFVAVYFPFTASRIMTHFRAKLVVVGVYVLNIILESPYFFIFNYVWKFNSYLNETVAVTVLTDFYLDNRHVMDFHGNITYNLIFQGTWMLLTFIVTPATGYKVWVMTQKRKKLTAKKIHFDPYLAKMLSTVCIMGAISYTPFTIMNTFVYLSPSVDFDTKAVAVFNAVGELLFAFCSSVNFFIYVTMSSKFSRAYMELFCRKCQKTTRSSTGSSYVP